jgi:4'-phosphopantetheinyl transferase
LRALPAALQRERFFDYWTLKEAYVKGRGMGMSIPFDKFTIKLSNESGPTVVVDSDHDDFGCWQLQVLSLTSRHRLACAVRLGKEPPCTFSLYSVVPFSSGVPQAAD